MIFSFNVSDSQRKRVRTPAGRQLHEQPKHRVDERMAEKQEGGGKDLGLPGKFMT